MEVPFGPKVADRPQGQRQTQTEAQLALGARVCSATKSCVVWSLRNRRGTALQQWDCQLRERMTAWLLRGRCGAPRHGFIRPYPSLGQLSASPAHGRFGALVRPILVLGALLIGVAAHAPAATADLAPSKPAGLAADASGGSWSASSGTAPISYDWYLRRNDGVGGILLTGTTTGTSAS